MFYARINSAGEFRKILEAVREVTTSVNICVNNYGLSIQASESLYLIQVKLKIPSSYFSEFKVQGSHTLGVNLNDLVTLIKLGQADNHLILQYSCNASVIKVSLEASKLPIFCDFTLNLINLEFEDTFYVEVSNTGKFTINSKSIYSTFNDLSLISEFIHINLNKMRVKFRVCTDIGGGSVNLKHVRGENGVLVSTSKTFNIEINLALARKITKAHTLCERVEVRVYDGEPVIFCYFFEGIELKYYLAPALEESS